MPNTRIKSLGRSLYLLLPCLLYLYAVGRAPHQDGADLLPAPDAEEYAILAGQLAQFQAPLIPIGLYEYPSRYSLAYPALLAPAAALLRGDVTRFYLGAALFGLLAVGLLAHTGGWMLGSRLAGGVAAAFFALHPQTIVAATCTMSETGILMVFFLMLELARPWLEPREESRTEDPGICDRPYGTQRKIMAANPALKGGAESGPSLRDYNAQAPSEPDPNNRSNAQPGLLRGALLGLALGWLTLAKAPFAYWAVALAVLVAARALALGSRRAWGAFAALVATGLACALGDLLYRRWAFGSWAMNGYKFWAPHFYTEFLKTFNIAYLREPAIAFYSSGNLAFYGRTLLGIDDDFYGRYMMPVAAAALIGLAWPGRGGRPSLRLVLLMAGWAAVGALFCGFYFFQETRFPHLWIPLIDLLAAWGLVRLMAFRPRVHRQLWHWVRWAPLLIALLLLRGEYRRVRDRIFNAPDRGRPALCATLAALLAPVPEGAWLFTNTKPLTVERARAHPGPTGSLYTTPLDFAWPLLSMHVFALDSYGLPPRRARGEFAQMLQNAPQSWKNKAAELIGLDGSWRLTPEERRAFFNRPAYALVLRPAVPALSRQIIDEQVMPLLAGELAVERIGQAENFTLYRLTQPQ